MVYRRTVYLWAVGFVGRRIRRFSVDVPAVFFSRFCAELRSRREGSVAIQRDLLAPGIRMLSHLLV